jgi:hypothetical protein
VLGHARSEEERRWLRTRAVGAACEVRRGEASGWAVMAACFGRGDGVSDSGAVGWCLYGIFMQVESRVERERG